MAVNTPQKFAKDFWPSFNRIVATVIVVFQLSIIAIVASVLFMFGVLESHPVAFIGVLAAQAVLGTISSFIVYRLLSRPIKDMVAAIVHVSGEPTATTPPNPNDARFEKSGFKDILQTIYELSSRGKDAPAVISSATTVSSVVANTQQPQTPVNSFLETA